MNLPIMFKRMTRDRFPLCPIVLEFIIAVLLMPAGLGCMANRPTLTCPNKGGPAWTETRSAHFTVKTDQSEDTGKQIAVDLETGRAALLAAMGAPLDEGATSVEVVALEREEDFLALIGRPGATGAFISRLPYDVEIQPIIVLVGGLSYETRLALQHELTHQILRRRTAQLPWWLDEGLAELYSTLRIDSDGVAIVAERPVNVGFWEYGNSVTVRGPKVDKLLLSHKRAPGLDELLGADKFSVAALEDPSIYYAAAGKLMHVLRGHANATYAPRFSAMMADLMTGTEGRVAFARAYKGVLMSEIETEYQKMLLDARESPRRLSFQMPADLRPVTLAMTDAEVHAVWARISTVNKGAGTSLEEQLTQGVAESPGALPLLYVRAAMSNQMKQGATAREDIERLLQADPTNPKYLILDLVDSYESWAHARRPAGTPALRDRVSALADKLLLVAESPGQRRSTAIILAALGRLCEALSLSEKSVRRDPSCGPCFEGHAIVLLKNGLPREAKAAIERAIRFLPDGASTARTKAILDNVEEELKRASPPPAEGSAPAASDGRETKP